MYASEKVKYPGTRCFFSDKEDHPLKPAPHELIRPAGQGDFGKAIGGAPPLPEATRGSRPYRLARRVEILSLHHRLIDPASLLAWFMERTGRFVRSRGATVL